MDIFYKNEVNAGTLSVFRLPKIRGQANLFFFNQPAPKGDTFVPGVIITKIRYQQGSNTQFQQSLDNIIYVYSFGDQMGNMTIEGMAFPRLCSNNNKNGVSSIMEFYQEHRVSRSVAEVRVTLAGSVIRGFLVGMGLNTLDTSSGAHSFSLLLRTIPAAFARSFANDTPASSTTESTGANTETA